MTHPEGFTRWWARWVQVVPVEKIGDVDEAVRAWMNHGHEARADRLIAAVNAWPRSDEWKRGIYPLPQNFLTRKKYWQNAPGTPKPATAYTVPPQPRVQRIDPIGWLPRTPLEVRAAVIAEIEAEWRETPGDNVPAKVREAWFRSCEVARRSWELVLREKDFLRAVLTSVAYKAWVEQVARAGMPAGNGT